MLYLDYMVGQENVLNTHSLCLCWCINTISHPKMRSNLMSSLISSKSLICKLEKTEIFIEMHQ